MVEFLMAKAVLLATQAAGFSSSPANELMPPPWAMFGCRLQQRSSSHEWVL